MKIVGLTPELVVEDVAKSIEFYIQIVGLKLIEGNDNWGRLGSERGEIILMLKNDFDQEIPGLGRPKNEGWFLLVVEVTEIEGLFKEIAGKMVVKRKLTNTLYGTKEFTIEDPDGYLVQFSQKV